MKMVQFQYRIDKICNVINMNDVLKKEFDLEVDRDHSTRD